MIANHVAESGPSGARRPSRCSRLRARRRHARRRAAARAGGRAGAAAYGRGCDSTLRQGAIAKAQGLLERAATSRPARRSRRRCGARCALAYQTAGGLDSERRAHRSGRTGEIVVTTQAHGARRWFAADAQGLAALGARGRRAAAVERAGRVRARGSGRAALVRPAAGWSCASRQAGERSIVHTGAAAATKRPRDTASRARRRAGIATRTRRARVRRRAQLPGVERPRRPGLRAGEHRHGARRRFGADLRAFRPFEPARSAGHDAASRLPCSTSSPSDAVARRLRSARLGACAPRRTLAPRGPAAASPCSRSAIYTTASSRPRPRARLDRFRSPCAADAALDPANFVAHLSYALQGAARLARAAGSLRPSCAAARPRGSAISARASSSTERDAARLALVYLRPRWSHLCDALIERAARSFDV